MAERLFKLFGALLLAGSLGLGWLWMEYQGFADTPMSTGETATRLVIEPGTHLRGVAGKMVDAGLIDRPRYLVLMAKLSGLEHAIKAGEYEIAPGTTPRRFLDQITNGEVLQYAFTIIEGWTFDEMMAALAQNPYFKHTLGEAGGAEVMAALGHAGKDPEGRFLPETYHFPRGTRDIEFLRRAYDAMDRRLQTEWENRAVGLPLESPREALTLASIIEKETAVPKERQAIAGVFIRRLEKGMRLQTDPTVIYGLGKSFDGNIRRSDLKADTPYNTYVHKGLPPGPIAMPGADAIHAALHPAEGDALYFVARGDGSHHFSATLQEHNKAVIKYQLNGRNRSFSSNP